MECINIGKFGNDDGELIIQEIGDGGTFKNNSIRTFKETEYYINKIFAENKIKKVSIYEKGHISRLLFDNLVISINPNIYVGQIGNSERDAIDSIRIAAGLNSIIKENLIKNNFNVNQIFSTQNDFSKRRIRAYQEPVPKSVKVKKTEEKNNGAKEKIKKIIASALAIVVAGGISYGIKRHIDNNTEVPEPTTVQEVVVDQPVYDIITEFLQTDKGEIFQLICEKYDYDIDLALALAYKINGENLLNSENPFNITDYDYDQGENSEGNLEYLSSVKTEIANNTYGENVMCGLEILNDLITKNFRDEKVYMALNEWYFGYDLVSSFERIIDEKTYADSFPAGRDCSYQFMDHYKSIFYSLNTAIEMYKDPSLEEDSNYNNQFNPAAADFSEFMNGYYGANFSIDLIKDYQENYEAYFAEKVLELQKQISYLKSANYENSSNKPVSR